MLEFHQHPTYSHSMSQFEVSKDLLNTWLVEEDFTDTLPNSTLTISANRINTICNQAAQWGADLELDLCLKLLEGKGYSEGFVDQFKSTRRPDLTKKVVDMLAACINNNVGVQLKPHDIKNILDVIQDLSK